MLIPDPRDKAQLIDPLFRPPGRLFWIVALVLLAVIGFGGYQYFRQVFFGLGETGMNRPVYWGAYMVNFIFLIGVSMAGTLISAALQLVKAEWRSPVTRIAEAVTVFGLIIATLQIFLDMGRPERGLLIFVYGRLQSPLLWDATSLSIYLLTSMFALYLQLLPDIALLRDNVPVRGADWQRWLYAALALGWRGNREQWLRLQKAITAVSVAIIPVGISLHTVTSWIFSTTVQPGWKSTILGPYFVVGAVFSGIGMLFVVMTLVSKVQRLDAYIGPRQFRNLGWVFIVMNLVWFYFTYTEHLSLFAQQESQEFPVLTSKMWGEFSPMFWGMVILMFAAFWIMVVPKLIPPGKPNLPVFHTLFLWVTAGSAALLLLALVFPNPARISASLVDGNFRTYAWMLFGMLAVAAALGFTRQLKNRLVLASVVSGAFVVIAMWVERWTIIIPVMTHPRLIPYTLYLPTLTEIGLTAASAALLVLMLLVFFRIFPAVSIWEVSEQRVIEEAKAQLRIPPPQPHLPGPLRRGETAPGEGG
jgi:molybdopterin-containing oxidoreductase family membrane subunit